MKWYVANKRKSKGLGTAMERMRDEAQSFVWLSVLRGSRIDSIEKKGWSLLLHVYNKHGGYG